MANKLFFSWQSDTNSQYNTNFIRSAIKDAIEKVSVDYYYDEATRQQIGSVDIADTLFQKIKNSTVLIADITTINSTQPEGRKIPNPNVMLELGYAAAILGWNSIIPIFNLNEGDLQDVPFDMRNRRIVTYRVSKNTDFRKESNKLAETIAIALEEMDIELVKKRDSITRAFANQSEVAKFQALYNNDDPYWNAKLLVELLSQVIFQLRNELVLTHDNIIFDDPVRMKADEFLKWVQETSAFQRSALESLRNLVQVRTVQILNAENAIETLKLTQTIARVGERLIQLERRRKSIKVHELLVKYRDVSGTNMDGFITFFEKLIDMLATVHLEGVEKTRLKTSDMEIIFNLDLANFDGLDKALAKAKNSEQ